MTLRIWMGNYYFDAWQKFTCFNLILHKNKICVSRLLENDVWSVSNYLIQLNINCLEHRVQQAPPDCCGVPANQHILERFLPNWRPAHKLQDSHGNRMKLTRNVYSIPGPGTVYRIVASVEHVAAPRPQPHTSARIRGLYCVVSTLVWSCWALWCIIRLLRTNRMCPVLDIATVYLTRGLDLLQLRTVLLTANDGHYKRQSMSTLWNQDRSMDQDTKLHDDWDIVHTLVSSSHKRLIKIWNKANWG